MKKGDNVLRLSGDTSSQGNNVTRWQDDNLTGWLGDKMTNWHDRKVRYWQGYMITRLIGDKVSQPSKNNKSSKKAKNVITKIYFLIAVL